MVLFIIGAVLLLVSAALAVAVAATALNPAASAAGFFFALGAMVLAFWVAEKR